MLAEGSALLVPLPAIDAAHENPVVLEMWGRYHKVCTYVPIGEVPEAAQLFSPFTPVDV